MSRARKAWAPPVNPDETPLYSWRHDRRATRGHIREAVHYALCEKRAVAVAVVAPNEVPGSVAQQWRERVQRCSIKQLARRHLEYWRYRAHMGLEGSSQGSHCPAGWPLDRPAYLRWRSGTLLETYGITT